MKLTCSLLDEQDVHGRSVVDPVDTDRTFGIIVPNHFPPIPDFTIYNRSGEVMVSVVPISTSKPDSIRITSNQKEFIEKFHKFTFTNVLKMNNSTEFDLDSASNGNFLVVPIHQEVDTRKIDWKFVETIVNYLNVPDSKTNDQDKFVFSKALYEDAVVIPKYRRDKQAYFYVAKICDSLTPKSQFPDTGYETFEEYYSSKYGLVITNLDQPLLDVDHTSSRLNLLTPRYLNRKGASLLENCKGKNSKRSKQLLQQKQILVPELCNIHPFPASFWQKAVTLPSIIFRLNSLLVADELRFQVAKHADIGCVDLPAEYRWPPLDFGWSTVVKQAKAKLKLRQVSEKTEMTLETPFANIDNDNHLSFRNNNASEMITEAIPILHGTSAEQYHGSSNADYFNSEQANISNFSDQFPTMGNSSSFSIDISNQQDLYSNFNLIDNKNPLANDPEKLSSDLFQTDPLTKLDLELIINVLNPENNENGKIQLKNKLSSLISFCRR